MKCNFRFRQTDGWNVQSVEILKHQWAFSSEKAERELGYKSRPLEEGLRELLVWLKAIGSIKY